jgi:hypothetical protein
LRAVDPLVAQSTIVKAVHVTEVNAVRTLPGLTAFSFRHVHQNGTCERTANRARRGEIRARLACAFVYRLLTPTVTPVKAAYLQELRAGVK